jgi:bacterioferritin (cytochrome b1)
MEEILAKEEEHAEDLKTLIEQLGAAQKSGQKPDVAA